MTKRGIKVRKNVRAMIQVSLMALISAGCLTACGPKDAKEPETPQETYESVYGTISDDDLPKVAILPSPEIRMETLSDEELTREVNQFYTTVGETTEPEYETEVYDVTTEEETEVQETTKAQ